MLLHIYAGSCWHMLSTSDSCIVICHAGGHSLTPAYQHMAYGPLEYREQETQSRMTARAARGHLEPVLEATISHKRLFMLVVGEPYGTRS